MACSPTLKFPVKTASHSGFSTLKHGKILAWLTCDREEEPPCSGGGGEREKRISAVCGWPQNQPLAVSPGRICT